MSDLNTISGVREAYKRLNRSGVGGIIPFIVLMAPGTQQEKYAVNYLPIATQPGFSYSVGDTGSLVEMVVVEPLFEDSVAADPIKNHQTALDLLSEVQKYEDELLKVEESLRNAPDSMFFEANIIKARRIRRSKNDAISAYNAHLKRLEKIPIDEADFGVSFIEYTYKTLGSRIANCLKRYFLYVDPIEHPGKEDVLSIDMQKMSRVRGMGTLSMVELQEFVEQHTYSPDHEPVS